MELEACDKGICQFPESLEYSPGYVLSLDPPAFASQVLGLDACAITLG